MPKEASSSFRLNMQLRVIELWRAA